jgi:hypothetical protein
MVIAEQGGWLYRDHWAVAAVFRAAVDLQQEVKAELNLTVSAEGDPMVLLNDLLKRRLGLEVKKSKKVTQAIVAKEGHLKNLSAPLWSTPRSRLGSIAISTKSNLALIWLRWRRRSRQLRPNRRRLRLITSPSLSMSPVRSGACTRRLRLRQGCLMWANSSSADGLYQDIIFIGIHLEEVRCRKIQA